MIFLFRNAIRDLKTNFFLNTVTFLTVTLAVLIFSAFTLFFFNAYQLVEKWIADMGILVYLEEGLSSERIAGLNKEILAVPGVADIQFIPKDDALKQFVEQLGAHASLVKGLKDNPLPDSFEVRISRASQSWDAIEPVARQVAGLTGVTEVEYGQQWLARFIGILNIFKIAGSGLSGLFFMSVVFFVANTIRLTLYSRREEIEIMRLVGASESFIKDPFYIQSLLLGSSGGIFGLGILYCLYRWMLANTQRLSYADTFQIHFLPLNWMIGIVSGSMIVGLLGCFISLRQFLKY